MGARELLLVPVERLGKGLLEELALPMGFGVSGGVSQETERAGGEGYSQQEQQVQRLRGGGTRPIWGTATSLCR